MRGFLLNIGVGPHVLKCIGQLSGVHFPLLKREPILYS